MAMTNVEDNNFPEEIKVDKPKDQLENLFTYHAPTEEQIKQYANLRSAALEFARVIHENTPESPDRTAAIRSVREAVMTANAGIATGGGFYR